VLVSATRAATKGPSAFIGWAALGPLELTVLNDKRQTIEWLRGGEKGRNDKVCKENGREEDNACRTGPRFFTAMIDSVCPTV